MPQGLQVFDESGTIIVDSNTFTIKTFLDIGEVTANGSTSISIPAGTTPVVTVDSGVTDYTPNVSLSGGSLTWSKPAGTSSMRGRVLVDLV